MDTGKNNSLVACLSLKFTHEFQGQDTSVARQYAGSAGQIDNCRVGMLDADAVCCVGDIESTEGARLDDRACCVHADPDA